MSSDSPLYCGTCLRPVQLSVAHDWSHAVHCPACRAAETLERAFDEANACLQAYVLRESPSGAGLRRSFRFVPGCLARRRQNLASPGDASHDI